MHVNKVYRVTTINLVAEKIGVSEDLIWDVADEMDPEAGRIWVYGINGDDGVMAFTDDGIENLIELIEIHKENEKYRKP